VLVDSARVMSDSKPVAVQRLDLDRHQKELLALAPTPRDQPFRFGLQAGRSCAVRPVHRDAGPLVTKPDDRIAGHRGTALRQLDQQSDRAR
jgi:hypothetical protein